MLLLSNQTITQGDWNLFPTFWAAMRPLSSFANLTENTPKTMQECYTLQTQKYTNLVNTINSNETKTWPP